MTKPARILRNIVFGFLGVAVFGYGAVCGYMYLKQDALIYMTDEVVVAAPPSSLPIEALSMTTPDGATIRGWYEPPKAGQPVILFLHGQGAGLYDGRYRFQRMHDKGVGYLAIDYRGFGTSTGKPSEEGLYTDAETAYQALLRKGFRPDQIVIHGHSLGSGVATWLASQHPARALILEAPFTAASDVAAERYPYLPVNFLMRDKFMSRGRMKDIHMPVLIVHGDRDSVIPFAHGQRLFTLANQPKQFVTMKGSDHSTLTRDGVYEVYWKFLGIPTGTADTKKAPAETGAATRS